MTYQDFMSAVNTRFPATLNGLKTNLVSAGVAVGNITVESVDSNDLRWRITARRGGRTFICYLEVTAAGVIDAQMAIVITVWAEGNGTQISTSFVPGPPAKYTDATAIDGLFAVKLVESENLMTGEILTAARAFLQV